jgi:hypothetical protein
MGNTAPAGTIRTQIETAPQAAEYDNHSAQDAPSRVSIDAKESPMTSNGKFKH